MSGLLGSLSVSVKALNAHSRAIDTAGRNLANVNNPNYARQRVVMGDRGTVMTPMGPQSLGMEARYLEHLRDRLLDQQTVREVSNTALLKAQQSGYERAQAALGQSISRAQDSSSINFSSGGFGISESITDFFNAFQSFAASPTDMGERQTLVQKAGILADRFNVTDERLAQLQGDLTSQINEDVAAVNRILSSIAQLNGEIGSLEINHPNAAVDLRDKRQALLEELAGKMSFETRPSTNSPGQIEVYTSDGVGGEIQLVNRAVVYGTVAFSGSTLTAGATPTAVALSGGSIMGARDVRDVAVQDLRDQIDALASQLVTSVNAAYNPTNSTGDFFLASGTTAGSIAVASGVTPVTLKASDGGAAGDNTIATAVAALAGQSFSVSGGDAIDGTFTQFYARSVTSLGQQLSSTNSRLLDQQNVEAMVRGQRDAVSGVSMDEEMADLLKYQRSYQASSRVITVIDDLLDTLINRTGLT